MAKRETSTTVPAVQEQQETNLPAVRDNTFAPMEGYGKDDLRGKEGITAADWKPAFLCIAQQTSKVIDVDDDAHIVGIRVADIYNSETKVNFGRGPIEFQLLRHRKRAYLPDENGRMGEDIPWDDPRCEWPTEEEKKTWQGKGKPRPEGVRCYDWVVLLLNGDFPELAVITFKSKSFGAGQTLAKWAGMLQGPAFTAKFRLTSQKQENDAGKFGVFAVATAGKPTPEQASFAAKIYDQIANKDIPTDDHVDDAPETEGAAAPAAAGTTKGEKTPF